MLFGLLPWEDRALRFAAFSTGGGAIPGLPPILFLRKEFFRSDAMLLRKDGKCGEVDVRLEENCGNGGLAPVR